MKSIVTLSGRPFQSGLLGVDMGLGALGSQEFGVPSSTMLNFSREFSSDNPSALLPGSEEGLGERGCCGAR